MSGPVRYRFFPIMLFPLLLIVSFSPMDRAFAGRLGCSTSCHKSKVREDFVHGPVRSDDCIACHNPTGLEHPKEKKAAFRLAGEKAKLCYICHESKSNKKYVHGPVGSGDCLACHDVHQSPYKMQLRADGADLCFMCHEKSDAFKKKHWHAPVASGKCTGCHDPHQSDFRYQLRGNGADLCYVCHDKNLTQGVSAHEPALMGDCLACHIPHGSDYTKILKNSFPADFYLPYNQDNFGLCFECHTKELAQDRRTDTLTGFRNGDKNLHFIHINKPDKGRSCKTCHDPHAAGQARLIKGKIPGYGKWEIPITFVKTDTGGTCVAGCHKPKSYDRANPVRNP